MNNDMETNLKKEDNIQYSSDSTYYAIVPFSKGSKLWILLSFNNKEMKNFIMFYCN